MNHSFARLDEAFESMEDDVRSRSQSRSETPSRNSENTYVIGRSRSPSVLSGVSSPISSLDTDDYDSDRDVVKPHEFRSPEPVPEHLQSHQAHQVPTPVPATPSSSDPKLMKMILRIQRDLQKIVEDDDTQNLQGTLKEFSYVEMGLFVSVGLFVLLAMNMMLQMGKQHVTYRFSSFD
jgi:hypothetical protein